VSGEDVFTGLLHLAPDRGRLARNLSSQQPGRVAVLIDGVFDDRSQLSGTQRFQRVQLYRALAVLSLELPSAPICFFDRHAREGVLSDLIGGEDQRDQSDVEILVAVAAEEELDLACDRYRHAVPGRIVI
jgi:hypothetical protein